MSLVSLKRYFNSPEEESASRRVIWLLLQGISLHTVEGDRGDYNRFRIDFDHIKSSVTEETPGEHLVVVAGKIVQLLADYGQRTTRFIRQQGVVLRSMISMLTETVVNIASGAEESAQRLQEIEQQLARAIMIEDVQELKQRLDECLTDLRQEAARQKAQAKAYTAQIQSHAPTPEEASLKTETRAAENPLPQPPEPASDTTDVENDEQIDEVTGLPTRSAAKELLAEQLQMPGRKYVIIAVVNRINSINTRFGQDVGDQVLKAVSEFVRSKLSSADGLFRWHGGALVALLRREQPIECIRADIRKISQLRLEKMFDVGGRRVMVPLSASWQVLPLVPPLSDLTKSIDAFIATAVAS